jgi:hypothetical protein
MSNRKVEDDDLESAVFFVWARNLAGPAQPQKWMMMDLGIGEWKKRMIIKKWQLPREREHLTIDELKKLYPLPDSNGH